MKICLLTYEVPHLKTAQIFMGLHNRRFGPVDLLLMPFSMREKREVLFSHRPEQFLGPSPRQLSALSGGTIYPYADWPVLVDKYDYFLVCGSNLIEAEFANSGKILNVHSGLIPAVRGLDAFKWTILDQQPLGNTLHYIDERADAGKIIASKNTPVFAEDTLSSLAVRHYENEIWMATHFDLLIQESAPYVQLPEREAARRMSTVKESEMIKSFDGYKEKFGV